MDGPDLDSDIERMTAYCTYCPKMCRFSCPTAGAEGRETVTPWGMMRLLELARDNSVTLDAEVAETFYHCTGCRRCQTYCAHENDVPKALWKARQWAADSGFLPEVHETLNDQFHKTDSPYDAPADGEIDLSAFDAEATIGYWPDCSTVANKPHLIGAVGRLLSRVTGEKIRLIRASDSANPPCCGFPLTAAGIEDAESCRSQRWPALNGLDTIWTDCSALAAWNSPKSSWPLEPHDENPVIGHIITLLAERLPEIPPPEHRLDLETTVLHQSCFVARQIDAIDDVDAILKQICKTLPATMAYEGGESPCCGGRVHYRVLEPEASTKAAQKIVESLDRHTNGERIVTTSSMCQCAMAEATDEELVTSLLELVCQAYK